MERTHMFVLTGLMSMFVFGDVLAQEEEGDLEGTIRLMGHAEAELPDAVTKEITLPVHVVEDREAVDASAEGLATANEARQRRETGLGIAAEARENAAADARENAADMAEEARENAENRSRADEFRPETPEVPERPEVPQPPTGGPTGG
ncbi:MAG: hypothetical protein WD448_09095 [Woeseia sp.]